MSIKNQVKLSPLFLQDVAWATEQAHILTSSQQPHSSEKISTETRRNQFTDYLKGTPASLCLDTDNNALRLSFFVRAGKNSVCCFLYLISRGSCWKTFKIISIPEKGRLFTIPRHVLQKKGYLHSTLHCGARKSVSAAL